MADETWKVGMAVGTQSALGTPNNDIVIAASSLAVSDGIVLGDREEGDADSGISIPTIERSEREVADVAASFTRSFGSFLKAVVTGFSVAVQLKGNGAASTPSSGEAKPDAGIDALMQMAGWAGANGSAPLYEYTPAHDGSSGGSTVYGTVKLWVADLSFVFSDVAANLKVEFTPAGLAIATFDLVVGTHDPATDFADTVTFPTFAYGNQQTLSAPIVKGVGCAWGQTRGFESLTFTTDNNLNQIGDSNQTTGERTAQDGRLITLDGALYVNTSDSDYAYQATVNTTAPTDDLSFQVGTIAGASDTLNAVKFEANNLSSQSVKYNRQGTATVVELSGAKCTGTTAGSEAKITFN